MVGQSGKKTSFVFGVVCEMVRNGVTAQGGHFAAHCGEEGVACTDVPLLDEGGVHVGIGLALEQREHLEASAPCRDDVTVGDSVLHCLFHTARMGPGHDDVLTLGV